MLHRLQAAIEPALSIKEVIAEWDRISEDLNDNRRCRASALNRIMEIIT